MLVACCLLGWRSAGLRSCVARRSQIVLSETPHTRGKLPPPRVPEQCPQDVWDLIVACSASNVSDRPSAKGDVNGVLQQH